MKAKMLVWLSLAAVWAIYMYLVYPLLSVEKEDIVETPTTIEQPNNISIQTPTINEKKICFQDNCFSLEVADTVEKRQQGLMNRSSLSQDAGMLFVFDVPDIYGFWMKNTLIPLDIIRLDKNFVVVDTATMTPCTADPCPSYVPQWQSLYALEVNAWLVQKYSIQIWDIATYFDK